MITNEYTIRAAGKPEELSKEKEGAAAPILQKKREQFLLEKRIIFLWDEVDEKTSREVVDRLFLLEYDKPAAPIHFYINSPGGSVSHGMAIYDAMQLISSPVHTVCIGLAASMASILLSGGAKGKRCITPRAEVMIHQPLLSGAMRAVSKDLEIEAEQMEKTKSIIAEILAKNCGQTTVKVMKDIDRNYWMSAAESIKYGIADSIAAKVI